MLPSLLQNPGPFGVTSKMVSKLDPFWFTTHDTIKGLDISKTKDNVLNLRMRDGVGVN